MVSIISFERATVEKHKRLSCWMVYRSYKRMPNSTRNHWYGMMSMLFLLLLVRPSSSNSWYKQYTTDWMQLELKCALRDWRFPCLLLGEPRFWSHILNTPRWGSVLLTENWQWIYRRITHVIWQKHSRPLTENLQRSHAWYSSLFPKFRYAGWRWQCLWTTVSLCTHQRMPAGPR